MNTFIKISTAVVVSAGIAFAVTAASSAKSSEPSQTEQIPPKIQSFEIAVTGARCSQYGWPSYEAKCQFDTRDTGSQARLVRVIALR